MGTVEGFQCVKCLGDVLSVDESSVQCRRCRTVYPIVHGIPIMIPDCIIEKSPESPSSQWVEAMARHAGLAVTPHNSDLVKRIWEKRYRFGDPLLDAEAFLCAERAKAGGAETWNSMKFTSVYGVQYADVINDPDRIQIRWICDYLPRIMLTHQSYICNVRLENIGCSTISSQRHPPTFLSYHWLDPEGGVLLWDGPRSPFIIDLEVGRQITLPILVEAPEQAGRYLLKLCLVTEGVQWFESCARVLPIEISRRQDIDLTDGWHKSDLHLSDYGEAHRHAVEILKAWLADCPRPYGRAIEIGGNCIPVLAEIDSSPDREIVNVDVDVHSLQLGELLQRQAGRKLLNVAANAGKLPFVDRFFDFAVIFASLHHFPEPVRALRSIAAKVQPEGRIFIMAEPLGPLPMGDVDPVFLGELLKGANEQVFSASEYAEIFLHAGLRSEKVILETGVIHACLMRP